MFSAVSAWVCCGKANSNFNDTVSVDNAIQQVAKCSTDEKLDKISSIQQERCDKFVEHMNG